MLHEARKSHAATRSSTHFSRDVSSYAHVVHYSIGIAADSGVCCVPLKSPVGQHVSSLRVGVFGENMLLADVMCKCGLNEHQRHATLVFHNDQLARILR